MSFLIFVIKFVPFTVASIKMPGQNCTYKDKKVSCGCSKFRESGKIAHGPGNPLYMEKCQCCGHLYFYHGNISK